MSDDQETLFGLGEAEGAQIAEALAVKGPLANRAHAKYLAGAMGGWLGLDRRRHEAALVQIAQDALARAEDLRG